MIIQSDVRAVARDMVIGNLTNIANTAAINLCRMHYFDEDFNYRQLFIPNRDMTREVTEAKQILFSILRELGFSVSAIADVFNLKHPTVIYHTKQFDNKLKDKDNYLLRAKYSQFKEYLLRILNTKTTTNNN